ncbi:hypothetical protein N431DRAFT_345978 [Stipitochalara longipes BDJ]|nr:hypothetical protein N431DRAFT_345978 [Stipitochalara longipes BDJ]
MEQYVESTSAPAYSEFPPSSATSLVFDKPIVISQQTNIFHIKTFSPFARAYSPTLSTLPSPIPRDLFLTFIDGLNAAFLSSPIFQVAHVIGGGLLGSQILPAQAVGGVFQVASVLGSAGVSIVRVRKYMKKANEEIFKRRDLVVKIMSTKKMMDAVGYREGKGKLTLPPMEELKDLTPPAQTALTLYQSEVEYSNSDGKIAIEVEDPRMRRLKALEGFIAPLELEKEAAPTRGVMDKYGGAPLRWLNNKQDTKLQKAATRSVEHRRKHSGVVEEEFRDTEMEIYGIEERMREIRVSAEKELDRESDTGKRYEVEARMESELAELEGRQMELEKGRDDRVKEVYKKGDKKLEKLAKKEEKIANRILWIVVTRMDESVTTELVDVEV